MFFTQRWGGCDKILPAGESSAYQLVNLAQDILLYQPFCGLEIF